MHSFIRMLSLAHKKMFGVPLEHVPRAMQPRQPVSATSSPMKQPQQQQRPQARTPQPLYLSALQSRDLAPKPHSARSSRLLSGRNSVSNAYAALSPLNQSGPARAVAVVAAAHHHSGVVRPFTRNRTSCRHPLCSEPMRTTPHTPKTRWMSILRSFALVGHSHSHSQRICRPGSSVQPSTCSSTPRRNVRPAIHQPMRFLAHAANAARPRV